MHIPKNQKETLIKKFIVIFYVIGGIGIGFNSIGQFVINLTPVVLFLSFVLLMLFHCEKLSRSSILLFLLIYLISLAIEIIGVNTGIIFGEYEYGKSLGLKIFNTPVIIGLNWLLLSYITSSIMENYNIGAYLKIILASILMLLYDIVLEMVAPILEMWKFKNDIVPLKNYISWFIMAIVFNSMIKIFRVRTSNSLSKTIFIAHSIFFILVLILWR